MNRRIFFSKNGVLSDESANLAKLDNSKVLSATIVSGQDALYIGADFPCNSIFINIGTANANATTVSLKYWDGNSWISMEDVSDETGGLFASGKISFTPDQDYVWSKDDTEEMTSSGLETLKIRGKYWLKLEVSADTSAMTFSFIGHKFCDDNDLSSEYPELSKSSIKTSWQSGKTSWAEQEIRASEYAINDLKFDRLILDGNQILRTEDLKVACCHKTAQIIFAGMGQDYENRVVYAQKEYQESLDRSFPVVDRNKTADVSLNDETGTSGQMRLYR